MLLLSQKRDYLKLKSEIFFDDSNLRLKNPILYKGLTFFLYKRYK